MATAKKITIHDVALAAGVSVSTVSLVLSGKGRISTATGERVNAAIEELGFVRNRQASALRGGQSGVIGLIVRDLSAPFYAELTAGLTEALEAQGRMVFLLHGGKDGEQLAQRFSLLLNQGVDGVVIAGAAGSSDDLRRMAEEKAIPVIFASRASYLDDVDTVRPDNMQAAQLLTEHLIRNGHQRIAWLGGQSSSLTRAERVGGYCATLLKFGLPFHSDWVLECTSSQKQAAEAITALYVITRPSVPWFAITKLLRWGHGLVCSKQGGKAGKAESIVTLSNRFRWRHLPMRHQPHLMIYLLPGPARQRGNLVSHLRIA